MKPKAAYGTPCNGCGRCCINIRCPAAQLLFGPGTHCPALVAVDGGDGNTFACGLIVDAVRLVPEIVAEHGRMQVQSAAAQLVAIGAGCDAQYPGEVNITFQAQMREHFTSEGMQEASAWARSILFGEKLA